MKISESNESKAKKIGDKIFSVIVVSIIVIVAISIVAGASFFGVAGLFKILGVEYESWYSFFIFFLMFGLIGVIADIFAIPLSRILASFTNETYQKFLIVMIVDCLFSWMALHTTDELMSSITIPTGTEFITVIVLFLAEHAMDDKTEEKKRKSRRSLKRK